MRDGEEEDAGWEMIFFLAERRGVASEGLGLQNFYTLIKGGLVIADLFRVMKGKEMTVISSGELHSSAQLDTRKEFLTALLLAAAITVGLILV